MMPHTGISRFANPARGSCMVVSHVRVASMAAAFMMRPLIMGIAFTSGIAARITLCTSQIRCMSRAWSEREN